MHSATNSAKGNQDRSSDGGFFQYWISVGIFFFRNVFLHAFTSYKATFKYLPKDNVNGYCDF